MNKWWLGAIFFVLSYAFFMVSQIPLRWVINKVSIPDNINLHHVEGTLWRGSIKRVIVNGYTINNVNTDVNILSLLLLNVSVNTTFGGALFTGPEGKATVNNLQSNIDITNANVSVAANDIAKLLPLPIPVVAKQFVDVQINEFVMGETLCEHLTGEITWVKAIINALDNTVKLGTLKGDLGCDKGAISFNIHPKNNLGLTFSAYVYSPERLSGNGFIKPGNKFPAVLRDVLPFIGQADQQGRYKLSF